MADAETMRGTKLLIKIGDGATPEVFTHNCSINGARSMTLSAGTNETSVPDCDDPDLMAWVGREKVSLSAQIQGAGVLNTPDIPFFDGYFRSPDPKNCRVVVDVPGADGGGYWAGAFHLTEFAVDGDRGTKANFAATMVSDGSVSFSANA